MQTETTPTLETAITERGDEDLTAETPPDDANPGSKAQLTRIFVRQQGERGDAMTTRVQLEMVFTAPRLNPFGESTNLILQQSKSELEGTAEFREYDRLRGRVADTESQRQTVAKQLWKCEVDLPAIIRRGDDPAECEREITQSRPQVATLTDRLRILRQAEAEAHRKCSNTAGSIVRSASSRFREEVGAALTSTFAEFAECQQFVDLCRAHDRQREAYSVNDRHIADSIVPDATPTHSHRTDGPEAIITRADLGDDAFETLRRERVVLPQPATVVYPTHETESDKKARVDREKAQDEKTLKRLNDDQMLQQRNDEVMAAARKQRA